MLSASRQAVAMLSMLALACSCASHLVTCNWVLSLLDLFCLCRLRWMPRHVCKKRSCLMAEGQPAPHAIGTRALPWVCSNKDVNIASALHYLCEVPSLLERVGHQAAVMSCSGPKST